MFIFSWTLVSYRSDDTHNSTEVGESAAKFYLPHTKLIGNIKNLR